MALVKDGAKKESCLYQQSILLLNINLYRKKSESRKRKKKWAKKLGELKILEVTKKEK